jgi:rhamnosyl/mannosyltransferase
VRVLHVYRTYFPDTQGGLEEVIRQICLNTRPLGVESRVLALSADPSKRIVRRDEARVYRGHRDLEVASCGISFETFKIYNRLAMWADVVHYHFPWPFADLLHLTARTRRPSVVTYHSDIVRQRILGTLYAPLMGRFLKSVDKIVCTSPNYFATSDVLTRFEEKVEVVPIGIDERSYPQTSDAAVASARQQHGEGFFLFVGVLRYYKGLHILLDAMQGAPYRVLIVGAGPTETELKAQARDLGLDNVTFTGRVPDETKMALFKLARAVVFPSYLRSEAFGVALLEGAMSSRPLVSTEVGSGTSHVNVDGETGLVVTPGSSKALRHAMDQLYFRPDMAASMGARARRRYEQLFSGSLMGDRYARVYETLAGAREALPLAAGADD